MKLIRFIMVGGFLGAGKTTTLSRLARTYTEQGKRVGLVTNDQAQNLVDTNLLRSEGFQVEEVPGACFCCRFEDLIGKMSQLAEHEHPDVILAEPVGSCTDLVATVIQPIKDLYPTRFSIAPYVVLFKPSHGLRILRNEGSGFSPKAAYIFRKQLEEADAIVINRIDEITPEQLRELKSLLAAQYPATPVLAMSARTGNGLEALIELLNQEGAFGRKILEIDYDIYAEGEAELGWLNCSLHIRCVLPVSLDTVLLEWLQGIHESIRSEEGEVAHLKVIGLDDGVFGVANLTSSGSQPELSLASGSMVKEADLIVNARIAIDPALLEQRVKEEMTRLAKKYAFDVAFRQTQSLRPSRPVPTHRYDCAVHDPS